MTVACFVAPVPGILFLLFPFSNFLEDVDWLDFVNPLRSGSGVHVASDATIVCGRRVDSACVVRCVYALHLVKNGMVRSICVL